MGSRTPTETTDSSTVSRDPITRLQERYAEGELTEAEFEVKLDRLIDANERAKRAGLETAELSLERSP